jgi:hypothetical protein
MVLFSSSALPIGVLIVNIPFLHGNPSSPPPRISLKSQSVQSTVPINHPFVTLSTSVHILLLLAVILPLSFQFALPELLDPITPSLWLLSLQNNSFISNLTSLPTQFPPLIFQIHPNDTTSIEISNQAGALTNFMQNDRLSFNFNASITSPTIQIFIAPEFFIQFNDNFTFSNVTQLIGEPSHELLGSCSMKSIMSVRRLFAVVFGDSKEVFKNSEQLQRLLRKSSSGEVW